MRFLVFLFVVVSMSASSDAKVADVTKQVASLAKKEWNTQVLPRLPRSTLTTPDFIGWETRLSDPIPQDWPRPSGRLVYYAHARGMNPMVLKDAEFVGPVWATIEVDLNSKKPPMLVRGAAQIRKLGMQGVRPLTAKEKSTLDVKVLENLAKQKPSQAELEKLRAYYSLQRSLGNVPEFAIDQNDDFFAWVDGEKSQR